MAVHGGLGLCRHLARPRPWLYQLNYCRQKWRISLVRDTLPGQIARVTGLVSLFGGAFLLLAIG